MSQLGGYAPLLRSLSGRVLAVAWIATLVFGLIFGLVTRVVVTRELRRGLQMRAAALGEGLSRQVSEAVAVDDMVGLQLLLHEAVESNRAVRYVVVLNEDGRLVGHSFSSPPSTQFLSTISDSRAIDAPLTLSTELGRVYNVVVRSHPEHGPLIHIGADESLVANTILTLTVAFTVAGVISLLVGLVVAGAVTRWIALPLREVSAVADQIASSAVDGGRDPLTLAPRGEAPQIRHDSSIAEVTRLTSSFNRMSRALHDSRAGLAAAQQTLIQTERMAALGSFVAGTAHAINNPLGGLRACVEMMAGQSRDEGRVARYAAIAGTAIDRIDDLVQRLIHFVRADGLKHTDVDLNKLVRGSLVVDTTRERGVKVRLELHAEPLHVVGNADEFEQALTNLVLNAVHASPTEGEVVVRTALSGGVDAGWFADIQVQDSGPGIAPELRQRIFEPFFTTKPVGEGTGLGLWIVWSVARRHGGMVDVAEQRGGGATITMRLPCAGPIAAIGGGHG